MMYLVPLPRVRLEVGDAGVRNAQELCRWLYGDGCEYASRAAPSVMTRSECELFGLSSPRFAYRLYIKRSGEAAFMTTFLNLRRLVYFAGALAYTGVAKDILSDTQTRLVDNGIAIADSMLLPPRRCQSFKVLTTHLSRYYGEPKSWDKTGLSPFMQHTSLGGGACAQACIYMAMCLMQDRVNSILGIAEITAIAKQGGEFVLDGLGGKLIISVLNDERCGLRAFSEAAETTSERFDAIWRAYLLSGFPIICMVNLNVLCGRGKRKAEYETSTVWGKNGVPYRIYKAEKTGHHCVLVVGAHERKRNLWLIHDSAKYPFLEATSEDLRAASRFEDDGESSPGRKSQDFNWIAILPGPCSIPLVGHGDEPESASWNVLSIAYMFQTTRILSDATKWLRQWRWPGELRLVELNAPQSVEGALASYVDQYATRNLWEKIRPRLYHKGRGRSPFVWLQLLSNSSTLRPSVRQLWAWDACPTPGTRREHVALAAVEALGTELRDITFRYTSRTGGRP